MILPATGEISPLNFELFEAKLRHHPDRAKVNFVLEGIKDGFSLGCEKPVTLKSAKRNKVSAYQHSGVIDAFSANKVRLGRVVGPFDSPPVQNLHISISGVTPKKGQPGKWHLIVDLSSPHGHSVNDGINPDSWHLQYIKIDDIIKMASKFVPGTLLAKFDIGLFQKKSTPPPFPTDSTLEILMGGGVKGSENPGRRWGLDLKILRGSFSP